MFIWQWSRSGSPAQVVAGAHSMGLSFLVLRASGSDTGFDTKQILADLLPRAHAAGIKVIGSASFPNILTAANAENYFAYEVVATGTLAVTLHGIGG
jgi:hypothetical protein